MSTIVVFVCNFNFVFDMFYDSDSIWYYHTFPDNVT